MFEKEPDAATYARNQKFFTELRKLMRSGYISRQEVLTLRGQALSGDSRGAQKGLDKLMADRRYG